MQEIELGLIWHYLLKLSSTVKQEARVMEVILDKFIYMLKITVFPNRHVKPTKLKIQINSIVQIFKNAWIVQDHNLLNLEIKEIVGHKKNSQFGKLNNTVLLLEQRKWKPKFMLEVQSHVVLMLPKNLMLILEVFLNK